MFTSLEGNDEVFARLGWPSLKVIKDLSWVTKKFDQEGMNTLNFEARRIWIGDKGLWIERWMAQGNYRKEL